ncbi:MAG: hypothetical protein A3D65_04505 [Candidatus Lloydbacteria bacterium RIFCSPHIGHO2_02_FULL_50_13]|uniref:Uncharacterized protein n=1 Tax=Candidatus Lloydbacteria bacterium RIFCSPHIGHO2_02_FULL_50_13 TaxID=1798661 RepID=A0A1G2DD69_9BACT|nr:MAG: hypothetical protein A3D65_04505 [Candidatus Lloydbacteria bacterium RIFCSPHIGHO2_02_FULL_50_13]
MIPLGAPHSFGSSKPTAQPSALGGQSSTPHNAQEKMHLENRLRIEKIEVIDAERRIHDLEREIA